MKSRKSIADIDSIENMQSELKQQNVKNGEELIYSST